MPRDLTSHPLGLALEPLRTNHQRDKNTLQSVKALKDEKLLWPVLPLVELWPAH